MQGSFFVRPPFIRQKTARMGGFDLHRLALSCGALLFCFRCLHTQSFDFRKRQLGDNCDLIGWKSHFNQLMCELKSKLLLSFRYPQLYSLRPSFLYSFRFSLR